jgi:hypothetical protein
MAVMIRVSDVAAARAWYQRVFPAARPGRSVTGELEWLEIGGVQLELVPADDTVGS